MCVVMSKLCSVGFSVSKVWDKKKNKIKVVYAFPCQLIFFLPIQTSLPPISVKSSVNILISASD